MGFLSNLFGKKDEPIKTNEDFWNWFLLKEREYFKVVKARDNIVSEFIDKISPKLHQLNGGFFCLAGMQSDDTAELIITADGNIKNIVFVEEFIQAAPKIEGWVFTALKPAENIEEFKIDFRNHEFSEENIHFYPLDDSNFDDEISIVFIHDDLTESNSEIVKHGVYIFIENYLGELNFALAIDDIEIIGKHDAISELQPISELKEYLIRRQNEFAEKYESIRKDTDNDSYSMLEATLEDGKPFLAVVNSDLLRWEHKASHPWILRVTFSFDGSQNNGMPDETTYQLLGNIESEMISKLKDSEGYLNIGRETADGSRDVYFACKEFRKSSKTVRAIQLEYSEKIDINYEFYRDKYWKSMRRFEQ